MCVDMDDDTPQLSNDRFDIEFRRKVNDAVHRSDILGRLPEHGPSARFLQDMRDAAKGRGTSRINEARRRCLDRHLPGWDKHPYRTIQEQDRDYQARVLDCVEFIEE